MTRMGLKITLQFVYRKKKSLETEIELNCVAPRLNSPDDCKFVKIHNLLLDSMVHAHCFRLCKSFVFQTPFKYIQNFSDAWRMWQKIIFFQPVSNEKKRNSTNGSHSNAHFIFFFVASVETKFNRNDKHELKRLCAVA